MKAHLKQVRISPKKANLIAGIIRNEKAVRALEVLKYMPKKGADILYKVLASAVSNAENNFGQKKEDLVVSQVLVTDGPTYKRGQSHSKGRVTPLLKRTSHITVSLAASAVAPVKESASTKTTADKKKEKTDS